MMQEHYKKVQLDCGTTLTAFGVAGAAGEASAWIKRCRDVDPKGAPHSVVGILDNKVLEGIAIDAVPETK